jgi:hypothetical protein
MQSSWLNDLNFVPLQAAVLCADCEVITENRGGHCRICGGRALLSLANVLGGPIEGRRATLLDAADAEVTRLVEELIESAYRPLEIDGQDEESTA